VIEHREALIYMLFEAAELEHGIMCQYLFAVCLQPIERGRVRCGFDRLSGFMIRPGPRRSADGLTVMLVAFDALAIAGVDLCFQPWHERRKQLERLLGGAPGLLRLTWSSMRAPPSMTPSSRMGGRERLRSASRAASGAGDVRLRGSS